MCLATKQKHKMRTLLLPAETSESACAKKLKETFLHFVSVILLRIDQYSDRCS